jgi:hypothetical protein
MLNIWRSPVMLPPVGGRYFDDEPTLPSSSCQPPVPPLSRIRDIGCDRRPL